jgi:hypothetical protein
MRRYEPSAGAPPAYSWRGPAAFAACLAAAYAALYAAFAGVS